jgi:hypothetical protein
MVPAAVGLLGLLLGPSAAAAAQPLKLTIPPAAEGKVGRLQCVSGAASRGPWRAIFPQAANMGALLCSGPGRP